MSSAAVVKQSGSLNPPSPPRRSVIHHFAAIPQRALGDRRLKAAHLRVLGAVCRAIDPETGFALISQQRIAHWANMPRQKVGKPLNDLQVWGYLEKVRRGRRPSGRFLALQYHVLYDPPTFDHDTPLGDSGRVTPGGDRPVSPPGVTDSDPSDSNIQEESEEASGGFHNHAAGNHATTEATKTDESDSTLLSDDPKRGSPATPLAGSAKQQLQQHLRAFARQKANNWENNVTRQAEQRICAAFFKAFPGETAGAALAAFTVDDYEYAIELEKRKRWVGANFLRRKVRKTICS